MSEQPITRNDYPLAREGTRFDAIVDPTIDLRASGMKYDPTALRDAREAAVSLSEIETEPSQVERRRLKLRMVLAAREESTRNEDKPFLQEAA